MFPASRVLWFALGGLIAATLPAAETQMLPPIFNPRVISPPASAQRPHVSRAGLSDRVRAQLTERILSEAKVFEVPPPSVAATAGLAFSPEGAVMMDRFIVKSVLPRRDETELPPLPVRFHPVERIDRKRHVLSATLFEFMNGSGSFNLNVVNGAGSGVDHARQFTRVEFEFSIKW